MCIIRAGPATGSELCRESKCVNFVSQGEQTGTEYSVRDTDIGIRHRSIHRIRVHMYGLRPPSHLDRRVLRSILD